MLLLVSSLTVIILLLKGTRGQRLRIQAVEGRDGPVFEMHTLRTPSTDELPPTPRVTYDNQATVMGEGRTKKIAVEDEGHPNRQLEGTDPEIAETFQVGGFTEIISSSKKVCYMVT